MKRDISYYKHSICMIAIFLFGNLLIAFPKGENTDQAVFGVIANLGIGIAVSYLFCYLQKNGMFDLMVFEPKPLKVTFIVLILALSVISFLITCKDYVMLIDKVRLPNTSSVVISVIFLLLAYLLARADKKLIYLFSLTGLIFAAISFMLLFLLSLPNMELRLFTENLKFAPKGFLKQTLTFFIHSVGQIVIAAFFIGNLTDKKEARRIYLLGTLIGGLILLICILNIVLVLGTNVIGGTDYPYATATGMIMLGKSYSRMDGFTYYIYFLASLIKASVILKVILSFSEKGSSIFKKIMLALVLVLGVTFASFNTLHDILESKQMNFILLILEIAVILFLCLTVLIKHKKEVNC